MTTLTSKSNNESETTEFGLSAARITKRIVLKRIEKDFNEHNKLIFVFDNSEKLQEITEAYWNYVAHKMLLMNYLELGVL